MKSNAAKTSESAKAEVAKRTPSASPILSALSSLRARLPWWQSVLLGASLVGLGFLIRLPVLGPSSPRLSYLTFWPMIFVAALVGGSWAGAAVLAFSAFVVFADFVPHPDAVDWFGLAVFWGSGAMIVGVVELLMHTCVSALAEKQTANLKSRLAAIVETSSDAIISTDMDGTIASWNAGATQMFGYDPDEMIGQSILKIIPASLHAEEEAMRARLRTGERIRTYETSRLARNGDSIDVSVSDSAIINSEGTIVGVSRIITNITNLKRLESELRLNEQRYRSLVEATSAITWSIAPSGLQDRPQPEWMAYTGQTAEEILDDGWTMAVHPDDRALAALKWREAAASGKPFSSEHRVRRHDGVWRWTSAQAASVRDEIGAIVEWFGMNIDIEERKQAELALARTRDQLAESQAIAHLGSWEYVVETGETVWSDENKRIHGIDPSERSPAYVDMLRRFVHPEDVAAVDRYFQAALAQGESFEIEHRILRPDGEIRWLYKKAKPYRDAQGVLRRFIGVALDITERKHASEVLHESEQRFRGIFENAATGVVISNMERRVELANPAFCSLLGYTQEELHHIEFEDLIHSDDREANKLLVERLMAGEIADFKVDNRYVAKDGRPVWVRKFVSCLLSGAGQITHVFALITDMTEIRQAQEAMRASEERLELAFRAAQDGIWDWNIKTGEVFYSHRWKEMLGYEDWEIEPNVSAWKRLLHPDDQARAMQLAGEAIHGTTPYVIEFRLRHKDGRYLDILSRGFPVARDAEGRAARVVGTHFDLTELRQTQQTLERTRELLEESQRIAHLGSWEYIAATGATVWSDEQRRIYGLDPEQPSPSYDRLLRDHVHPDDAPELDRKFRMSLEQGAPFENEQRIVRPGGEVRWTYTKAKPYFDDQGKLVRYIGAALDITDRALAEQALREVNRRKDEFLAMLAHELRNPLAPVRNGLDLLMSGLDADKAARVQGMVSRQVEHLIRLVDDLLDVSRISRGLIELRKERIDLAHIVHDAVEASKPHMTARGHFLKVSLTSQALTLDADPTRLVQALTNLLNNAAKFTEPGGHIEISARQEGGEAVVSVRDDGAGIPADKLTSVFDLFTQLDVGPNKLKSGLGIGLALVRSLVEMHGGRVEARSGGLGKGSEFIVRLPLTELDVDEPAQDAPASSPAAAAARRVLVVDDNQDLADVLSMQLQAIGADVRVAYSGKQALEIVAAFKPEVIFLDIGMPIMDGYETAQRIRQLPEGRGALLVALTGWGQDEDRRRSREAGFDNHLVKPTKFDQLQALLA